MRAHNHTNHCYTYIIRERLKRFFLNPYIHQINGSKTWFSKSIFIGYWQHLISKNLPQNDFLNWDSSFKYWGFLAPSKIIYTNAVVDLILHKAPIPCEIISVNFNVKAYSSDAFRAGMGEFGVFCLWRKTVYIVWSLSLICRFFSSMKTTYINFLLPPFDQSRNSFWKSLLILLMQRRRLVKASLKFVTTKV